MPSYTWTRLISNRLSLFKGGVQIKVVTLPKIGYPILKVVRNYESLHEKTLKVQFTLRLCL